MPPLKVEFGLTNETHKEVFTTVPKQPLEKKDGQMTIEQVNQYFDHGFVLIENFFKEEELEPVKKALAEETDKLARKLFAAGKIKELYEEQDFYTRLSCLENAWPGANILLHKMGAMPKAIQDVWMNERLLNALEQILGPEIAGSAVWNLRTKTPGNKATIVPWHQDSGYFDNTSYRHHIVTGWLPLLDATPTNGCLQIVKDAHKHGRVAEHTCCDGGTWYIMLDEDTMKKSLDVDFEHDVITLPVSYRSILLFNNLTPHRSLPNVSKSVRWSLDLRWLSANAPDCNFGIKDSLLLRSEREYDFEAELKKFNEVNRHTVASEKVGHFSDEFDTSINGPWMVKWDILNKNRHTESLTSEEYQRV